MLHGNDHRAQVAICKPHFPRETRSDALGGLRHTSILCMLFFFSVILCLVFFKFFEYQK